MSGEMRRPPQLWEQRLARTTSVLSVGLSSGGDTTAVVPPAPPPGSGGGVEPAPVLPPPGAFIKPSTPQLVGGLQGINVLWDGLNSASELWPYDTSWVEVHMDTTGTAFTPGTATLKGRLARPGSLFVGGLTAGSAYYFKLRGADPAGNYTEASDAATGFTGLTTASDYGTATIGTGVVSFNARQIGGVTSSVGTATPTSPVVGDIWLDTTGGSTVHKRWNGSSWEVQQWGAGSIGTAAITEVAIDTAAITAAKLAAGAVTEVKIDSAAVTAAKLAGSAVTETKIASDAITAPKIAANAVEAVKIAAGAVSADKIAAGAVEADKIAANAVTAVKIAAGSIETAKLAAGAVTAEKVAASAIEADKIAANAVTAGKIAANAVTATTIAGSAITADKLAANSVTATSIAAGAITAGAIAAGAVTTDKLTAGTITGFRINGGTISGGFISGGTVSAGYITSGTMEGTRIQTGTSGSRVELGTTGRVGSVDIFDSSGNRADFSYSGGQLTLAGATTLACNKVGTLSDIDAGGTITATTVRPTANVIVFQGYRTTATAADVIMRLSSDVTSTNQAKFEVDADGDVKSRTNSYAGFSDARYKENITPARDYLEDLRQVEVVTYNWQGSDQKLLGVTAQQIQPIFPNMVAEDEDGTLSVRYSVFVPMLITAVQSLADKVDDLTARIEALEA